MEEERKKKLQEEREAHRAKKREEQKKAEEARKEKEVEQLKLKNAREYYNRSIMIKYMLLPLGNLLEEKRHKTEKAKDLRMKLLLT